MLNTKASPLSDPYYNKMSMNKKQRSFGRIIQDVFSSILLALCIAVIIKVFFIEAFFVPSSSMETSIKKGDHVLVWKFLYNKKIPVFKKSFFAGIPIKRNDIIVFKLENKDEDYIKRIIGLPGDEILFKNNQVFVNGILLKETYVNNRYNISYFNAVYKVPEKRIFVMGDNRNNSRDSREFGFINIDNIIGKLFFIYYPFSRMRF